MIENLFLKNVATFDNKGVEIGDLKKVNFIYGANGSGKTTISNLLANPLETEHKECVMRWKGDASIDCLVYNKDFRDKNFGKGTVNGVFTLGQATKEHIDLVAKMQQDLSEIRDNGIKKKETIDKQNKTKDDAQIEFRDIIWNDAYKKNEGIFKEAFKGVMTKELFKERILTEFQDNKSPLGDIEDLKRDANTIFGQTPTLLAKIQSIDWLVLDQIESDLIWKKKIVGKQDLDISSLIRKLDLNDWVAEGRNHLKDNDSTCPFCQQETITKKFRAQLDEYFDITFMSDTQSISAKTGEYLRIAANIENILSEIEINQEKISERKLELNSFSAFVKTLRSEFVSNREIFGHKAKEPSRSLELVSTKRQIEDINDLINNANDEIDAHNKIVSNYDSERTELVARIWKYIIEENRSRIDGFVKKISGLDSGLAALNQQRKELLDRYALLNNGIIEANKNITSVQPSVDEINSTLKSYGFQNFLIVPSKKANNQYEILRENGLVAEPTLSEGEVTFITFLYYLQLTKGSLSADTVTTDRVLVIDDPISSLDSGILFVVSSLIKQIIKAIRASTGNIKQLILLTHNIYFHKEVTFIDGRTHQLNDTFHWILRKDGNVSSIHAFEMMNPITNSYQLLWNEVKNYRNLSGLTVQNTMRKIIESYFKILGKYGDDDLINSFKNMQEKEICRSLICWINDGSHTIPDDLFIAQHDTTTEKFFDVFKKIFVETGHEAHFNMMIR
jgi:wobble nucleotide-excising tRNase